MKIENFERYSLKLNKILDNYDEFCKSSNQEADVEIIEKIKKIKTTKEDENKVTKEKALCLMYITAINFLPTDKVKGDFPLSEKFLSNMIATIKDQRVIYHSHVTGKIIGYAHDFCNEKIRENYFTIPVIAHNQFRFYFFLLFKRDQTICLGNKTNFYRWKKCNINKLCNYQKPNAVYRHNKIFSTKFSNFGR